MENFFTTQGRIGRLSFFGRKVVLILIALVGGLVGGAAGEDAGGAIIGFIFLSVVALELMQAAKRAHDLGHTGWLALAALIPLIGIGVGLYLQFAPGMATDNQYGPGNGPIQVVPTNYYQPQTY